MNSEDDQHIGDDVLGNYYLVPLQDNIRFISSISGKENDMRIIYMNIVEILSLLENITERGFLVSTIRGLERS